MPQGAVSQGRWPNYVWPPHLLNLLEHMRFDTLPGCQMAIPAHFLHRVDQTFCGAIQ